MAVVVLCSVAGAPGVSATALAFSLLWPRPVVLVDADPNPNQTILAGVCCGIDPGGRGLPAFAQECRSGGDQLADLASQLLDLPGPEHPSRRFLPGFTHPGSASLFEPTWPLLAPLLAELEQQGEDVIVDLGRLAASGVPPALAQYASLVLVVTRTSLRALAALRLQSERLHEQCTSVPLGLVITDPDHPYSSVDIARQFELPVHARLPWEPKTAEALLAGAPLVGRFAARRLSRAYRAAASELNVWLQRRRSALTPPPPPLPEPVAPAQAPRHSQGVAALEVTHV